MRHPVYRRRVTRCETCSIYSSVMTLPETLFAGISGIRDRIEKVLTL